MTTVTAPQVAQSGLDRAERNNPPFVAMRSKGRGIVERWWIAMLVLPMMIASDWKYRRRVATSALTGSVDSQILIEVAVYGFVLLYVVLKHGRAPRLRRTSNLMFSLWFSSAFLAGSSLYAIYAKVSIVRGVQVLIICCVIQTIATNARIEHLHRFAHAYLVLVVVAIAIGAVHQFHIANTVDGRFHWLYVHPVPGAMWFMVAALISAAYVRSAELRGVLNLWPTWVYSGLGSLAAIALILTKTRGSIAGFAVALAAMLLLHTTAKTKLDIAAFGILILTTIIAAFGSLILLYLGRGEDPSKLATLNERTNLWAIAFQRVAERPITGYGLGASRGLFLDSLKLGGGHNAFVNVLVDVGVIGFAAFVAVLTFIVCKLWRYRRGTFGHRDALILLPVFVALLVNSITAEFLAVPANHASLWLMMLCGWIAVLDRADRSYTAANTYARV